MLALLVLIVGLHGPQLDALNRLQLWLDRTRLAPRSVDARRQDELRSILGELRVMRAGLGDETRELDLGLVELASLEWRSGASEDEELLASARLGRAELESQLARGAQGLARRLACEVLDPAAKRGRAERVLAAQLLEHGRTPEALPALCAAAREEDLELASAALTALCGWPAAPVHAFFLDALERDAPCSRLAAEHFQALRSELDGPTRDELRRQTARRYLSDDWRQAARARGLVRALDAERAVPVLIEALAVWDRRTREGTGSKRIRAEVLEELQRVSGRAIGLDPVRWGEWWRAVREGRVELPEDIAASGGQTSTATFFGLHAVTDRVVFLVDRSSSMRTAFGTGGRSRHEEAIDQLLRFLETSGPDTRFGVALFSDSGTNWRTRLTPATPGNLGELRRWLAGKPPEGETRLFEGLRAGLGLDTRGRLTLERCEADTVIVLCDGATTEGAGWVPAWLARENEGAQLVFHCVQIGSGGNGTLEALAQGSGGAFVRVDG